jgi:chromosome segregation ATPase
MSSAPYDQKNIENFEATTRQLNDALKRIEKDTSLRANVTELARIAGVHRNTIYQRKWPLERLAAIKEQRKQQIAEEAAAKADEISPKQRLEQSRLEIIYWFTQLQDARATVTALKKTIKETESSRNFYRSLAQERLTKINEQASDIRKLQDAIAMLEDEISTLKLA